MCASGTRQSPIDLPASALAGAEPAAPAAPLTFRGYDAPPASATLTNNGHTAKLAPAYPAGSAPVVSGGDLPGAFALAQVHFHWGSADGRGSEHTVDGAAYPLEAHLVHFNVGYGADLSGALAASKGADDALAVVGVFFELQDKNNTLLDPIIKGSRSGAFTNLAHGVHFSLSGSFIQPWPASPPPGTPPRWPRRRRPSPPPWWTPSRAATTSATRAPSPPRAATRSSPGPCSRWFPSKGNNFLCVARAMADFQTPLPIGRSQLEAFRGLRGVSDNFRPVQPLGAGRKVVRMSSVAAASGPASAAALCCLAVAVMSRWS